MKGDKLKKLLMSCIKPSVFLVAAIIACAFFENPFAEAEIREIFGKLSNVFTVPGAVFTGIGALSYFNYLGAYDGLGYAFANFGLHNIWVTRQPEKYKSFYDYKKAKDEKGRKWLPNVLIVGGLSFTIGVLLLLVYFLL